MSVTVAAAGTQTANVGVEHLLYTTTTAGIYVFVIDKNTLLAGDTVEFRVKTKVLGGGAVRTVYYDVFSDVQSADDLIAISVPLPTNTGGDFTLKQTAGVGRDFPWKVLVM